jgi:hypothetical protein
MLRADGDERYSSFWSASVDLAQLGNRLFLLLFKPSNPQVRNASSFIDPAIAINFPTSSDVTDEPSIGHGPSCPIVAVVPPLRAFQWYDLI